VKAWTGHLRQGHTLDATDVSSVAEALLSSETPDEEKADFLEELHRRGEAPEEIVAFAQAFLARAEPFDVPPGLGPLLDVCGTGGDKLGLFNVSTAVMFVAAGAGARVVKHGNRGVTSRSGGADVLEALGVAIDAPADRLRGMLEETGATFLFAPRFHPAFKAVAPARKILAQRGGVSIFNMLGPLLNPARPQKQLAGVFGARLVPLYAAVLPSLGRDAAWVVHGSAGGDAVVDEISTLGPTFISKISAGVSETIEVTPQDLGVQPGQIGELRGGDAEHNARILSAILAGQDRSTRRDLVVVNAAASLQVAGLAADWSEAMARAQESIDSGAAHGVLRGMQRLSGGKK